MAEAVQNESDIAPPIIVSLLRMRAEQQPDGAAYTLVSDGSRVPAAPDIFRGI